MRFLTATTLLSTHGAGTTAAAGTRCTLKLTGQSDPNTHHNANLT